MKKLLAGFAFALLLIGCMTADNTAVQVTAESHETVLAAYHAEAPTQVSQVIYGGFCCDGFMNRRCMLNMPLPVGTACFCYGIPGSGFTCM